MPTSESKKAHQHYISHFGSLNRHVNMTDHSLVLLDAPDLAEEDYRREQSGFSFAQWTPGPAGPVEFVERIAQSMLSFVENRVLVIECRSEPISCHSFQSHSPL